MYVKQRNKSPLKEHAVTGKIFFSLVMWYMIGQNQLFFSILICKGKVDQENSN